MSPAAPQGPTQGGCSHLAAWGPWESPPQHTACTGSGVGAVAPGRVPSSPGPANPQSSFSNWPWWGARRAARQPAGVGRARHGVPAVTTLSPRRAMAHQRPAPPPQSQARPAPALHNACCVRGAWAAAPGARHRQPHGPPRAALGLLRSPGMPRGTLHQVPAIPAGCWAQLGAGSRSRSPAAGSAVPKPRSVPAAARLAASAPRGLLGAKNLMICRIKRITTQRHFSWPCWGRAGLSMTRLRPAAQPGTGVGSRARQPNAVCVATGLIQHPGTAALCRPIPSWGDLSPPGTASRTGEPPLCRQQTHRDRGWGGGRAERRARGYLGAVVEIIHAGGVHEGLVEVGAGVDAPRDDELAGGVDDLGPPGDHQLAAHLLDDPVLDVDVRLQRAVVVHHLPPLDEDPHGGRVGEHGSAGRAGGQPCAAPHTRGGLSPAACCLPPGVPGWLCAVPPPRCCATRAPGSPAAARPPCRAMATPDYPREIHGAGGPPGAESGPPRSGDLHPGTAAPMAP